jgi:hypothetical protein
VVRARTALRGATGATGATRSRRALAAAESSWGPAEGNRDHWRPCESTETTSDAREAPVDAGSIPGEGHFFFFLFDFFPGSKFGLCPLACTVYCLTRLCTGSAVHCSCNCQSLAIMSPAVCSVHGERPDCCAGAPPGQLGREGGGCLDANNGMSSLLGCTSVGGGIVAAARRHMQEQNLGNPLVRQRTAWGGGGRPVLRGVVVVGLGGARWGG